MKKNPAIVAKRRAVGPWEAFPIGGYTVKVRPLVTEHLSDGEVRRRFGKAIERLKGRQEKARTVEEFLKDVRRVASKEIISLGVEHVVWEGGSDDKPPMQKRRVRFQVICEPVFPPEAFMASLDPNVETWL